MPMSQWQRIYTHLKQQGFDVYSPGQHKGDCIEPYVVLKEESTQRIQRTSSYQPIYDILCYVPVNRFSLLEPYVDSVKAALHPMYPEIIPTYYQTESFIDDTINGVMISVQYRSSRKI